MLGDLKFLMPNLVFKFVNVVECFNDFPGDDLDVKPFIFFTGVEAFNVLIDDPK